MIRLNKIASAVLAGTLALSLAACSGDTASSSSAADTSSASTGDTAASGELPRTCRPLWTAAYCAWASRAT